MAKQDMSMDSGDNYTDNSPTNKAAPAGDSGDADVDSQAEEIIKGISGDPKLCMALYKLLEVECGDDEGSNDPTKDETPVDMSEAPTNDD